MFCCQLQAYDYEILTSRKELSHTAIQSKEKTNQTARQTGEHGHKKKHSHKVTRTSNFFPHENQ
jgi:hypothetical protein